MKNYQGKTVTTVTRGHGGTITNTNVTIGDGGVIGSVGGYNIRLINSLGTTFSSFFSGSPSRSSANSPPPPAQRKAPPPPPPPAQVPAFYPDGFADAEKNDEKTESDDLACSICTENKRRCMFLECNHMSTCVTCTKKLCANAGGGPRPTIKCPMCQKVVAQIKLVFL